MSVDRDFMTADFARSLFNYDPESGSLTWRVPYGRRQAGDVAWTADARGYKTVSVRGFSFLVHRLAWLIVTGEWPLNDVDHINGDRSDCRFANLRDVPHKHNIQNLRKPNRNNKSGLLGVSLRPDGRYYSSIKVAGKTVALGLFETAQAAHEAYLSAKREHHEGCTI